MGPTQQITITVNGLKALVSYFRPHQPPHAHYHRRHRPCIHDYILMQKDRGFLYMSELDIGLLIPPWFVTLLKSKAHSPVAWGDVVLKAAELTAEMGVDMGIVGSAHVGAEETVKAAVDLGEELVKRNGRDKCIERIGRWCLLRFWLRFVLMNPPPPVMMKTMQILSLRL
ncbi:hypothetical protein ACH5RR_036769 [Cinchona calisaya]|uniref:Uncharacterized protein n=1 Tax=Cinchona calisaya TaxID=153742 RepID=A0ABD2Y805_9GENT